MRNAGMLRKGSPLYVPTNEREHDHWLGYPPIVVGIRITATLEDGRPLTRKLPNILLHAGWG